MLAIIAALALAPTPQLFDPITPLTKEVEEVARTVTGDFNGDGAMDVVLFARGGSLALTRLGDGMGNLPGELSSETGLNGCKAAAAGDLNGDGDLDVVLFAEPPSGEEGAVLFGTGDGRFGAAQPLTLLFYTGQTGRIRIVDLDGDGDPDILTGGQDVYAFQNLGGGNFAGAQILSAGMAPDVAVADLDGDGDLDVAHSAGNGLVFTEQTAPFQFEQRAPLPTLVRGDRIEAGDLDGDGDLDLVVGDRPSVFQFVENLGGGTFSISGFLPSVPDWRDIELSDINRDGVLDVVGVGSTANPSFWFENLGAFTFNFLGLPNANEPTARAVSTADLNGDGADDLVTTRASGAVDVLFSDLSLGAVPYGPSSTRIHEVLPEFESVVAVDLDGDGDRELIASTITDGVYRLPGIGNISLGAPEELLAPIPGSFLGSRELTALDLDGDGDQDFLCVSSQGQLSWLEGNGAGSLRFRTLDPAGTTYVEGARFADVDGDGDLDVLAATVASSVHLVEQTAPGIFAAAIPVVIVADPIIKIFATNVDTNATVDLLVVTETMQGPLISPISVGWSSGNGDGTFQASTGLLSDLESVEQIEVVESTSPAPNSLVWSSSAAAEMDIAIANSTPVYTVFPGAVQLDKRAERFTLAPIVEPLRDGLVVQEGRGSAGNPASIVIYRGSGAAFQPYATVATDLPMLNGLAVDDIDSDGALDIVIASKSAPRLSWIRNRREDLATTRYCSPAVPNQTGQPARISAFAGVLSFDQDFILQANELPVAATTLFLTSRTQGFQPVVPGSIGTLCLGGSIGRYTGPGQIQTANGDGMARLNPLRTMMPQPGGFETALDGSLWFFQAWYRDSQGGVPVSNFTDALAIRFD